MTDDLEAMLTARERAVELLDACLAGGLTKIGALRQAWPGEHTDSLLERAFHEAEHFLWRRSVDEADLERHYVEICRRFLVDGGSLNALDEAFDEAVRARGAIIVRLAEDFRLTPDEQATLRELLAECFPGYFHDRTYYKQTPHARFFAHRRDTLIAQLGMEDRVIRVGDEPWRIFGIMDLCVAPDARGQGVASRLLDEVEQLARTHAIDALVLFADDAKLYERSGYRRVPNVCRWFAIDEHRSLDVFERSQADCMMIKALGDREWNAEATVDLLGTLF